MADRIERFEIAVPAGTTKAAPLDTNLVFSEGIIEIMEVLVPPGPAGLAGFKIMHSGQVIIPRTGTNWIISNDFTHEWNLSNYPTGEKWAFRAHNTGAFPHTYYITLHVNELPRNAQSAGQLVSIAPFGIAVSP